MRRFFTLDKGAPVTYNKYSAFTLHETYIGGIQMKIKAFAPILVLLFLMTSSASNEIYNQIQPFEEEAFVEIVEFVAFEAAEEEAGEPEEAPEIEEDSPPETYEVPISRTRLIAPYLVRLMPYIDGTYTDGMNIFTFTEDGTVKVRMFVESRVYVLDWPDPPVWEIDDIEELKDVGYLATQNMGYSYWWDRDYSYTRWRVIHIENGMYYLHYEPNQGGGSGEAFIGGGVFVRVNADGDFKEFEPGGVHILWHDGHFYYVDLVNGLSATPGVGPIMRMDMNGENKTVIVDEVTYGPFQRANDRIFFSSMSGIAYSVDLNGNGRQPVGERIAPNYHRVWLEFYGSAIINRSWLSSGYSSGSVGVLPSTWSHPAIMCVYGGCLVTFPHELRGEDPFTVVAWGYAFDEEDERDRRQLWRGLRYFLILRSNYDESLWAYHKNCTHATYAFGAAQKFSGARYQLEGGEVR